MLHFGMFTGFNWGAFCKMFFLVPARSLAGVSTQSQTHSANNTKNTLGFCQSIFFYFHN